MMRFKLANIVLEELPQFVREPTLCCRSTSVYRVEQGIMRFFDAGTYDFTTFFGGLSTQKWRKYTAAKEFYIHMELRGAACSVVQTRADSFTWDTAEFIEGTEVAYPASEEWASYDAKLVVGDQDVLNAVTVSSSGALSIRNAYYYTEINESSLRPVELALATTTFRKEGYIERNIRLVKDCIVGSDEDISSHFRMHVVDNGRSLDVDRLQGSGVSIYPNNNVGGAGGFARGMIAALEQEPQATHVLLMDDDVIISPESIVRTYNLLRIVNDEYKGAFVSGAMMKMDEPEVRWEDTGFLTSNGHCRPMKPVMRMNDLHDVISNEIYREPPSIPAYADRQQEYAAWWYCCIPVSAIKQHGLPLPIFVRYDDVEYGLRCRPGFITMNGICVWHSAFDNRYNAAVERYQTTRNAFVAQSISGIAPLSDFTEEFFHNVQLELKKFCYANAELALEGFEDYLKGPSFIMQPVAEERFMHANRVKEQLRPFDEIREEALSYGVDLDHLTADRVTLDIPRTSKERAEDLVTFNGQRIKDYAISGKVGIIDARGWEYPAGKIRRAEVLIAVDTYSKTAAIRHKDKAKFKELWSRYKRDMKYYKAHKDELTKAYAAVKDEITSIPYWKNYLGIA